MTGGPALPVKGNIEAAALNDLGVVVGGGAGAAQWNNGVGVTSLGVPGFNQKATAINNLGTIAGTFESRKLDLCICRCFRFANAAWGTSRLQRKLRSRNQFGSARLSLTTTAPWRRKQLGVLAQFDADGSRTRSERGAKMQAMNLMHGPLMPRGTLLETRAGTAGR